jgi:ATP-binding cassette subfamily B protein
LKHRSHYWQLLPFVWPHWRILAQGLGCILGYVLFTLLLPNLAGQIATLVGQGKVGAIAQVIGISAVIFLVRGLCQAGQDIWMADAALKIALDLRRKTYSHLHKLNLNYFETTQTGDLTYRLTGDVDRIGEVINRLAHQLVPCLLQLVAIPLYMLYLNWQLTLTTLILAPSIGLLVGWFGERLLVVSRRSQNRASNLSSILTEVFSGIRLVQAFAVQDYEIHRFSQEAERNRQAKFQAEKLRAIQIPIAGFLQALSILLLFWVGGWQIAQGHLTGGNFVSFLTAVALVIQPIDLFTSSYNDFKQAEASVDRIFELFAVQPTVIENPQAIALPPVSGKVEYCHISFAYQPQQPILKDLSLLALPGERIALVGASGAGKTTLINLLPRFYDPQAGQVLIDGIDIRNVTLKSLRRQIGVVLQENILFSGTISQNIAFGQSTVDHQAIEAAAQVANAHAFISQFPEGYKTWVGERGVNLSGGQRQRIAIARAVLLNPRILILDEATSALDAESEALVQEALERLMQNRTVFIIAHRLSTVRRADRILVMEQGQIIESGTHPELLALEGRYAHFYAQQFEG